MVRKALILGCTGQDGSYLAEHLIEQGYEVHGMVRRGTGNMKNITEETKAAVTWHFGDMLDPISVASIIDKCDPHEIYNEADQDNVDFSYDTPGLSMRITATAVVDLLEVVRRIDKTIRIFQPCSAMMFGSTGFPIQDEATPFAPNTPYGVAKVAAYYACQHYRREYGMHISVAILYNHESERRDTKYLLHRICEHAAMVSLGMKSSLTIYNPTIKVDIGYAPEFVAAFPKMVDLDESRNYVLATGTDNTTIDSLIDYAFIMCRHPREKCYSAVSTRPGNPPILIGNYDRAERILGFHPIHTARHVVEILCKHYLAKLQNLSPAIMKGND